MRKLVRMVFLVMLIAVSSGVGGWVFAQPEDPTWVNGDPVCSGALPTVLRAGMVAMVTPGDPNTLRDGPSLSAAQVGSIPGGAQFTVFEGPTCADGYAWLYVDYAGVQGWTAQGTDSVYWLVPVETDAALADPPEPATIECVESRLSPSQIVRVSTDQPLRIRDSFSVSSDQVGQVFPGQILALSDRSRTCREGHVWWQIQGTLANPNANGSLTLGFVSEGYGGEYWLEPVGPPSNATIPAAREVITAANASAVTLLMELELSSTEVLNTVALRVDENGVPWLAVGTDNGSIFLGDLISMEFHWLDYAHANGITALAFDEDAANLASGDAVGNVQVRVVDDPTMPRFSWRFDAEARVNDLSFSQARLAAVAGEEAIVWDMILVDKLIHLNEPSARFTAVDFNWNGQQIVLGDRYDGHATVGDDPSEKPYGTVRLWDLASDTEVFAGQTAWVDQPSALTGYVGQVTFTADQQRIISLTNLGVVEQWGVNTFAPQTQPLDTRATWMQSSQDGTWAATTTAKGNVYLRDIATDTVYTQLINSVYTNAHDLAPEHTLSLSDDDTLLVSLGSSHTVLIWGIPAQ